MLKLIATDRYGILDEVVVSERMEKSINIPFWRLRLIIDKGESIIKGVKINEQKISNEKLIFPFYFAPNHLTGEKLNIIVKTKSDNIKYSLIDSFPSLWSKYDKDKLEEWVKKDEFYNYITSEEKYQIPLPTADEEIGFKIPYLVKREICLLQSLKGIINNPDVILMEDHQLRAIGEGVKIDRETIDYFSKHPETWYKIPGKPPQPLKILSRVTEPKYNVYSNQFVKMVLIDKIMPKATEEIKRLEGERATRIDQLDSSSPIATEKDPIIIKIDDHILSYNRIKKSCYSLLNIEYFQEVHKLNSSNIKPNQVLQKHKHYKVIYELSKKIEDKAEPELIHYFGKKEDRDEIHIYRDYLVMGLITAMNSLKFRLSGKDIEEQFNNQFVKEKYTDGEKHFLKDKFKLEFEITNNLNIFENKISISSIPKIDNYKYDNPLFILTLISQNKEKKILVFPLLSGMIYNENSEAEFQINLIKNIKKIQQNYKYDNLLILHNIRVPKENEWKWDSHKVLQNIGDSKLKLLTDESVSIIRFTTSQTKYPDDKKALEDMINFGSEAYGVARFYVHTIRRYLLRLFASMQVDDIKLCPLCIKPSKNFVDEIYKKVNDTNEQIVIISGKYKIKEKMLEGIVSIEDDDNYESKVRNVSIPAVSRKSEFINEMLSKVLKNKRKDYFRVKSTKSKLEASHPHHYCKCENISLIPITCKKCKDIEYDYFWTTGQINNEKNFDNIKNTNNQRKVELIEKQFNLLCYNTRLEDWSINDEPYRHFVCPKCGYGSVNYKKKRRVKNGNNVDIGRIKSNSKTRE